MTDPTSDDRGRTVLARDQVAASRALALFAGAGGLWVLVAAVTVPGFAGEGAMLGVSMAVGVVLVAIGRRRVVPAPHARPPGCWRPSRPSR